MPPLVLVRHVPCLLARCCLYARSVCVINKLFAGIQWVISGGFVLIPSIKEPLAVD